MSASAFLLRDLSVEGTDRTWLRNVYNATELPPLTAPVVFLADCLTMYAGKYIRYNATAQQAMLPSIATLAGVLGAVPLDVGGTHTPLPREATACVFDATITFGTDASNTSALEANHTLWMYTSLQPYTRQKYNNLRLDNTLLQARLLLWDAWVANVTGYLYW